MNANVNKNNTGKLLVAVLAMAMIFAGAAVLFSDDADAAETTYIHGGITAGTTDKVNNQEYTAGSVVVVDGDLTIPKYAKLTINGATFTVNSGYTVTIEVGGQLEIKGDAKVNINGTIETEGNCTETFEDSNNQYVAPIVINNTNTQNDDKVGVFVSGSLVLNNGSTLTAGTGEGTPAGTINVKNSATVEFNDGSQIIGQTFVLDNGASILYNGSTDKTGFTIKMNTSNGVYATTEVKITGAETPDVDADYSDLTFTASSKNISGYTWSDDKAVPKTIKQYTVAISGTVDNTETVTISSTISDNETYYTSAEYAEAYAKASTAPYKMWDSVVMGKVAIDNLNVENKASFVNDNAWMVVNGKITVADKSDDTTSDQGIVKNSGIVEVVGSIVISKDSFGGKATSTHGTIAINGGTVDFKDGAPGDSFLYGAMYTDDDDVLHISSLEAALNGAVADGVKKVSVYSTYGSGD